jgi:hypothetical protein
MKEFKTIILPVLLATVWISISEFIRNQFLLKSLWIKHYQELGITFPTDPLTGAGWGIWSLMFAITVFIIARKFSLWETTFISWFVAFPMMWLVLGNLAVLPHMLMLYALPLSILESFIAVLIVKKIPANNSKIK